MHPKRGKEIEKNNQRRKKDKVFGLKIKTINNIIKLYSSTLNKLERLSMASIYSLVQRKEHILGVINKPN